MSQRPSPASTFHESCAPSATTPPTPAGRRCGSPGVRSGSPPTSAGSGASTPTPSGSSSPAHYFGYPSPQQEKLHLLRELVDIAAGAGLHVASHTVRLVGRVPGHQGVEAVGPRRARAVRRRPADRVRRAQERGRHDGRSGAPMDTRARPVAAGPARRQTPVTVSVGGDEPGAQAASAGSGPAGGGAARLLQCALLHGWRRSGRARLRNAARPRCADAALDRRARLPDLHRRIPASRASR